MNKLIQIRTNKRIHLINRVIRIRPRPRIRTRPKMIRQMEVIRIKIRVINRLKILRMMIKDHKLDSNRIIKRQKVVVEVMRIKRRRIKAIRTQSSRYRFT